MCVRHKFVSVAPPLIVVSVPVMMKRLRFMSQKTDQDFSSHIKYRSIFNPSLLLRKVEIRGAHVFPCDRIAGAWIINQRATRCELDPVDINYQFANRAMHTRTTSAIDRDDCTNTDPRVGGVHGGRAALARRKIHRAKSSVHARQRAVRPRGCAFPERVSRTLTKRIRLA